MGGSGKLCQATRFRRPAYAAAMQIHPPYDAPPLIVVPGEPADIVEPMVRQLHRLRTLLGGLDPAQWAAPSRCAEWRVQDVVAHLAGTDAFWAAAARGGLSGAPTRFLEGFDPKATPAALSAARADDDPGAVLADFTAAAADLCELAESLTDDQCDVVAEAPTGHIAIRAVLHHALWDAWVHERDIVLPLGLEPTLEADEVECCLRYAVALSPAMARMSGATDTGVLAVDVVDPGVALTATVGDQIVVRPGAAADADIVLGGDAVDVLEFLSVRRPYAGALPDEGRWMLNGLTGVFEEPAY